MTAPARIDEDVARAARLRGTSARVFVAATGAGAGIQDTLWRVPGCSSFFVGAAFPYHAHEIEACLGFRPDRFASEETAIDLAQTAYVHALAASEANAASAIGLGLTASVATTAEHRGDHRIHVAAVTAEATAGCSIVLPKAAGLEARAADGDAADAAGLRVLLHVAGVARDASVADWSEQARARFFARPYWTSDGRRLPASEVPPGAPIFPGAFNPPHEGHFAMARAARGDLGPTVFAVCATPPHKPALTTGDLLHRAHDLGGHDRLFTEGDALYIDKARRMPGHVFLIGADALLRMLDPAWGPRIEPMLAEFASLGARFRVTGRLMGGEDGVGGTFLAPAEAIAKAPAGYRHLFEPVEGRWDLSSSTMRTSVLAMFS